MPDVQALVDVEALLVGFLANDDEVEATSATVSTELPGDFPNPYVQLWRLPGSLVTPETQHVERARVTFSVWGSSKVQAWDTAAVVFRRLAAAVGAHDLGVVSAVDAELTPYWSPDPETDDPRYLFTVALTVHP